MAKPTIGFGVVLIILGLVAYVAIYWMLPNTVDETVTIGATGAGVQELLARLRKNDYRFSELVVGIATSPSFRIISNK